MDKQKIFTSVLVGCSATMAFGFAVAGMGTFIEIAMSGQGLDVVQNSLKNAGVVIAGLGGVGTTTAILAGAAYNLIQKNPSRMLRFPS